MTKLGIIGQGFVGTAVREGLRETFDVYTYDVKEPKGIRRWCKDGLGFVYPIGNAPYPALAVLDILFLCLPTPMKRDGSVDVSIISDVLNRLSDVQYKGVVVIKSTVPPGFTSSWNDRLRICFNPEFLREATAIEDFKNQDRIILGGHAEDTDAVMKMYEKAFPDVPVYKTNSTTAELVKYFTNVFLATKVSLANEFKQISDALDVDYDGVIELATLDKRLGTSHWQVPGWDSHRGFGGSCLVKDLNALIHIARATGATGMRPTVMEAVWAKNLEVRPERDWEALTGRAVSEKEYTEFRKELKELIEDDDAWKLECFMNIYRKEDGSETVLRNNAYTSYEIASSAIEDSKRTRTALFREVVE